MSLETTSALDVRFPAVADTPDQDHEWCEVDDGRGRKIVRFHDYGQIFSVPGLYERIFHERLECSSPAVVCELLADQLAAAGVDPATLSALDLGAGNGLVAEALHDAGVRTIAGIDILEEAREAALRDRPGLYADYLVCDLTSLGADERERLCAQAPNCLATIAALGFDDIPPRAFATAYDLIADDGWIAFNIKADFLDGADGTGFRRLIGRMLAEGVLEEHARQRYVHRLSMTGDPLPYVALVGRKRADVPPAWLG